MAKRIHLAEVLALGIALGLPLASTAQNVTYSGKLQIGFGDQDNTVPTMARSNNAIPICAANPPSNPATTFPAGTTHGTLIVNGHANQVGSGAGATLTFQAVSATSGGAQEKDPANCATTMPPFANPRLRSLTRTGAAHWPGRKGGFTAMIGSAPLPAPLTATYRVSANGGNNFPSTTLTTTPPFLAPWFGVDRVVKGSANFGGGVPFSGGGGIQLGVQLFSGSQGTPPPNNYGEALYVNGFLPFDLLHVGTDAKGISILSPRSVASSTTFPYGLLMGRHNETFAARTSGGTTKNQHGAIRTVGGGNTQTPFGTFMGSQGLTYDCVTSVPEPCPKITSAVAFTAAAFEWTTGTVTHTDMIGDFTTIRSAMGFDINVAPSTAVAGETRRLQLVTPWSAAIHLLGPFGLAAAVPQLGFGGVAVLRIDIIPAPEPGALALLGSGLLWLAALVARAGTGRD